MLCAGCNTEWPLPLCWENNWAHFNPDHWTKWSQRAVKLYSCLPHFSSLPAMPREVTKIWKHWSCLHYFKKCYQVNQSYFPLTIYTHIYHYSLKSLRPKCLFKILNRQISDVMTCLGLENLNKLKGKHLRNRANTVH